MKALTLALASAVLLTPSCSFAGQLEHREHYEQRVEKHQEHIAKELGLTHDQKSKMKRFSEQHRAEIRAVQDDDALTPEQKRQKLMELHRQHEQFLAGILTPAQKTKWEGLRAERRAD